MSESGRNKHTSTATVLIELANKQPTTKATPTPAHRKLTTKQREYYARSTALSLSPSIENQNFLRKEMANGKQKLLAVLNTLISNATCSLSFCQSAHYQSGRNDLAEQKLKILFSWYVVSLNFFHQLTDEETKGIHKKMADHIIRALERINVPNLSDDHTIVSDTVNASVDNSSAPPVFTPENPNSHYSPSNI